MTLTELSARGLVLLGCGKMGSAMLAGWLKGGLEAEAVHVLEPHPSDWLKSTSVRINADLRDNPAVVVVAVKPQMMEGALPVLTPLGNGETLFLSIAAGTRIAHYEKVLGERTPIVRAMPNTPAAVAKGISAIVGNSAARQADLETAESLLSAIGQVVRLPGEDLMDAVTAVSGSGPAYVFHLIETLAQAGEAEGLPADLAMQLAKATVVGAGALAEAADEDAAQLRINVTSPGGTTAAALEVLMNAETGFPALLKRAVHAAAERGKELGK